MENQVSSSINKKQLLIGLLLSFMISITSAYLLDLLHSLFGFLHYLPMSSPAGYYLPYLIPFLILNTATLLVVRNKSYKRGFIFGYFFLITIFLFMYLYAAAWNF